jgi:hypothetical protein
MDHIEKEGVNVIDAKLELILYLEGAGSPPTKWRLS